MSRKIFCLIFLIFFVNCDDIPNDYCVGIQLGVLPHPDPTRCTEFVFCYNEVPYPMNCTRPNEIFHPPDEDCLPG
jgi:hypothetical protein